MIINKELFYYFEKAGTKIKYHPQDIIYMQEDDATFLYLITKGRVRVFDITTSGEEITYDILETGKIFGESSFLQNSPRPTTVVAVNEVELISCHLDDLYPYLSMSKELTITLLQMMNETCNHITMLLKKAYTYDRYEKIASFLIDLIQHDNKEKGIINNTIPYTHEEIATFTGLSRVTVTKVLKEFAEQNLIKNKYKKIIILDEQQLFQKYLSKK